MTLLPVERIRKKAGSARRGENLQKLGSAHQIKAGGARWRTVSKRQRLKYAKHNKALSVLSKGPSKPVFRRLVAYIQERDGATQKWGMETYDPLEGGALGAPKL